jgi:hypothetical protein
MRYGHQVLHSFLDPAGGHHLHPVITDAIDHLIYRGHRIDLRCMKSGALMACGDGGLRGLLMVMNRKRLEQAMMDDWADIRLIADTLICLNGAALPGDKGPTTPLHELWGMVGFNFRPLSGLGPVSLMAMPRGWRSPAGQPG